MTYDEWQCLLSTTFLRPHEGPTVLFIDDQELHTISPNCPNPVGDLAAAVRARLRIGAGSQLFAPITNTFAEWQRGPKMGPPPVLPLIAISTLAATRMHSDAQARSTNYYLRLAQVLSPDADPSDIEKLRFTLSERGAFRAVVEMWQGLHAWFLTQNGRFGISTIREHPRLPRIGYPMSQALVRQQDRMSLTRFFQSLDLSDYSQIESKSLLQALDLWVRGHRYSLSETFLRALRDDDIRPLLGAVVEAHAQAWDGKVLTPEGKQRINILLSIDLKDWVTNLLFPVASERTEVLELQIEQDAKKVRLSSAPGTEYYSVDGAPPVNDTLLRSGLRLVGKDYAAEFVASPVFFLREDPYVGAWCSVSRVVPYEEHVMAVRFEYADELRNVFDTTGTTARRIPQGRIPLLPGYDLFEGLIITDLPAFEFALRQIPALRKLRLDTVSASRARLEGGLPLAIGLSKCHYLAGGEPDLVLPKGEHSRPIRVTLDGRSQEFQTNKFPIELRRFISNVGTHTIKVDGQELHFTTLTSGLSSTSHPGTGAIGWTNDGHLISSDESIVICGAKIDDVDESVVVLARRNRDETWLLHDNGHVENVEEPPPLTFLSTTDLSIFLPCFEIRTFTTARWLAQRKGQCWQIRELEPTGSRTFDLYFDVLSAWKRACVDRNGERLWQLQLSMSEKHHDR